MNGWTILLLTAGLCALLQEPSPCVAVPAGSSGTPGSDSSGISRRATRRVTEPDVDVENDSPAAIALRRALRAPPDSSAENNDSNGLRGAMEMVMNRFGELESGTINEVIAVVSLVLSRIGAVCRSWLENIESAIDTLYPNFTGGSETGQRSRRSPFALSDLLASVPGLPANLSSGLLNPLGLLRQSVEGTQNLVNDQVRAILVTMAGTVWNVLVTRIFPWIRTFLDQIQKTNALPPSVSSAIQSVDTILDVARMLNTFGAA